MENEVLSLHPNVVHMLPVTRLKFRRTLPIWSLAGSGKVKRKLISFSNGYVIMVILR